MPLDVAVFNEARRKALEVPSRETSMVQAASPEETPAYGIQNGFGRRAFLQRAATIVGIGALGGLPAVLVACGGGAGEL
ncbi:hypothetical protein J4212_01840 [Candidatus Woesearchaeota archaeon]|nr:hypothetical protein [Candidatus Woesearchaeota archaeon]